MDEPLVHYVSCGMLVRPGRVFLVRRSWSKTRHPHVWDFPGGHLEADETGGEALVRGLREELRIEITAPVGPAILIRQEAEMFKEVWLVEKWKGDIGNAAPDEHDEIGWFSLDEAISLNLADAGYRALFNQVLG